MLTTFIKWFYAPLFPDDEEKTRKASLLNVVLNISIISIPALIIVLILRGNTFQTLIILTCVWLLTFGPRLLMLSGRVAMAGIITVIITFAGVTQSVYNVGTIRAPATSAYILTIIIAGLVIHRRAIIWTAIFSSIAVIMLWFGEKNGFLPKPNLTIIITQGIVFIVIFAIIAVLLFFAVKNIDEALVRTQRELAERMLTKEREINRRIMMEKVIHIGKTVTEQTPDFRTALFRIWDGVRNGLDFDRTAIFLYNPTDNMMRGSFGTNRSGGVTEEWDVKFGLNEKNSFFKIVLSQPDGFYFTHDYAGERNLSLRPGHPMERVKYYAAVAVWAGEKPVAIICVDQLVSGRVITNEQLEALRLFAGYAGLAIENARLNAELESHMQERENFIQELGHRNAELERFTYTVSHDLKSPLVTIKGFLGLLKKDMGESRQDRVQKDFERIAEAAEKMGTLLSDLLELSRIGRITNPPEEIDLVNLVQEALEMSDGRIRSSNVTVNVSPYLPIIYGDQTRLREVFENLIDNAAKYMGDQPNPWIEIGAHTENGEQIIFVRDNGMGIDPQYHSKVFDLFEKLNPTSEGTGIGLALIKRIIEVHGGRIWIESEGLGKGSTFCFTIPDGRQTV